MMGSKLKPGGYDCYSAALPDEPMFVLLARDVSAPKMLRAWADERRRATLAEDGAGLEEDLRKCSEADSCADDMTVWRRANDGRWRDGAELRHTLGEANEGERERVESASIKAIAEAADIPSQFHSGAVIVVAHESRLWASPLFQGRVHNLTLESQGRFENLRAIKWDRFAIQGADVADFKVTHEDHNRVVITLHLVIG